MKISKIPLPPRGKKIKKGLIEWNMTQRDLAKKLNMDEQYLADIIRGRRPGNKYIDQIYKELKLDPDEDEYMRGVV